MFEITGQVATAICFAKVAEEEAISQVKGLCSLDWNFSAPYGAGRIMPRTRSSDAIEVLKPIFNYKAS